MCVYHCVCCSTDPRPCAPGDYELLQPKTASPCSFARRPRRHFRLLTLVQVLDIDLLWKFMRSFSLSWTYFVIKGLNVSPRRAQALYMVIDMLRKKAAVADHCIRLAGAECGPLDYITKVSPGLPLLSAL